MEGKSKKRQQRRETKSEKEAARKLVNSSENNMQDIFNQYSLPDRLSIDRNKQLPRDDEAKTDFGVRASLMCNKFQRVSGSLAWKGLYPYDRAEQFDDGDQSPLGQEEGDKLKQLWCIDMDCNPYVPYLSQFTKCLLFGDYKGMMHIVGDTPGSDLTKLFESRETFHKVPALFHVV